ncbi:NAD(+) diphosphatase [Alteromonas sp. CYL-A6]|uniref:NAD(+) diphosphatase n=1 Tax=Alteromonas nitratireducens TaxID=3390813 RepID=UPI0034C11397
MMRLVSDQQLADTHGHWLVFVKDRLVMAPDASALPHTAFASLPLVHAYRADVYELLDFEGQPYPTPYYVVDMGSETPDEGEWDLASLRHILMQQPDAGFDVVGRAWQYVHFLRTHQFCGQCGARTEKVKWEMAVHCHQCGHRSYPRVSPCVIVAIHDGERILLAKGTRHRDLNIYSTLAGFVESGESLEAAVHREVFEEVGVTLSDIEYFDSQPWPFPHSLMVGFIARYKAGEIKPEEGEIDDAQWFDIDALPKVPPRLSIAGQLIEATIARLKQA